MRVIEARYDQRGELELLVDQIPTLETLRFQKLRIEDNPSEPGYLYVAEQDGYVDLFFQHDPDHGWYGQGYDGRQFTIFLEDGTAETLVGPWSSNTQLVNHYLPELAAQPVGLTHDRRVFQNLMATSAGAITAELRDDIVTRLQPTRPLGWLRHRYEALEAQLSSARPLPGRGVVQDSAAHQRWVTDNLGHFAEQALLLRAIAASSAAVQWGRGQASDLLNPVRTPGSAARSVQGAGRLARRLLATCGLAR